MGSSALYQQINYAKAYRASRLQAANWVLAHPETIPELLDYCFEESQNDLAHKAAWVLEFVALEELSLLYPYLDAFFGNLDKVKKNQSLRPLAHICELLSIVRYKDKNAALSEAFTELHKSQMIECCFDWLITEQKVACQVRAMTSLYYLGTEFSWIHLELAQLINDNIHRGSAAYKARGKNTLKKIKRYNL